MKLFVLVGILATITYVSSASIPEGVYDDTIYELQPIEETNDKLNVEMAARDDSGEVAPIRHRRVTCDVLSWQSQWLSVNHSACALRCLAQRRKGGHCENGVCVCRK
ncbi:Defensin-2 [Eufriesea mexicana]|uniref:Defensin-2 n=1 Tax=Eufriesea mexicana TaxID=516756 RepID=A0A310SHB7_9HYME|nr:PREDICTED: defensin-2-like [Eufriesea mexicana]OAD53675.1 Defensin-2 [Eufriesea mexicana]